MSLGNDCSEIRKMFKNLNEAEKKDRTYTKRHTGSISVYQKGGFFVDDDFNDTELQEFDEMEKLSAEDLEGFTIRDTDTSKTFYAYPRDIDRDAGEGEDRVEWAYAIQEAKIEEGKPTITAEPGIETETEPITTPDEPRTRPGKPRTPIRPTPSIQPKPKAINPDVELFMQKRGLTK